MRRQVLVILTAVTWLSVIDLLLCHRLGLRFNNWSRLAAVALPAISATAAAHRPRAITRARTL
jgi:hypothetical protein